MGCRRLYSLVLGLASWPESAVVQAVRSEQPIPRRRQSTPAEIAAFMGSRLRVVK